MPLVLPLGSPENTLETSGGKAANLGALIRAGLPVPDGWCLTTAAYDAIAGAVPSRQSILAAPFPAEIERRVARAYAQMGEGARVAVRSSATAEDLATASFAGQQDTYLGVVGLGPLLEAIRSCWASLWNERAVAYRQASGIDPKGVKLAVVVQRMVDAQVAGVLFTANPVTGDRRQAVVDASPGLGEAVVSGEVNPDHFEVDRATGRVLSSHLGDKAVTIRLAEGGGTRRESGSRAEEPCLSEAELAALAHLGDQVEACFGSPQDIEFALDPEGVTWLTQSRPITTLHPIPGSTRQGLRVYFSANVFQGVFSPFTPMGLQAFRLLTSAFARLGGHPPRDPEAGPWFVAVAGQRIFVDVTEVLRNPLGRRILPRVMRQMEGRSERIFEQLLASEPELAPARTSRLATVLAIVRTVARTKIAPRVVAALLRPDRAVAGARAQLEAAVASRSAAGSLGPADRLEALEQLLADDLHDQVREVLPAAIAGLLAGVAASWLLGDLASPHDFETTRRALPNNPTTEMDLALWQLARRIGEDPGARSQIEGQPAQELARLYRDRALEPIAQRGLADFLSRYGHRGLFEIDLGTARWSEDPAYLLGVIANYLCVADPDLAPDRQFRRWADQAEAMASELVARATRKSPLLGRIVAACLRRMRAMAGLREGHKFLLVAALARGRELLAPLAEELALAGRIDRPDDLYFLDLAEIRRALSGASCQAIVRQRREIYRLEQLRRFVPRVLLSDGRMPSGDLPASPGSDALSGLAASAGVVRGRARILLSPDGSRIAPGEILVAPSTDPSWTPLFMTASGLVMEMGGAMSHGAVVAREYGIPAVVGVPHATVAIADGAILEVDGSAGTVRVVAEAEAEQVTRP